MSGVNSGGGASSGDGAARQITQAEFQAASGEKWLALRNDIVSGKIKLIES